MSSRPQIRFYHVNSAGQVTMHPFSVVDLSFMAANGEPFKQTEEEIEGTYRRLTAPGDRFLEVHDPKSFRHVGGRFFRDDQWLYIFCHVKSFFYGRGFTAPTNTWKAYKGVDFETLEVLNEHLAVDAKNVYVSSGKSLKRKPDFKVIPSARVGAERVESCADMTGPDGTILFPALLPEYSLPGNLYFRQTGKVYFLDEELPEVDAANFKQHSGAYFTDGKSIYFEGYRLNCDSSSFRVFEDSPFQATDRYRAFYGSSGNAVKPGSNYESSALTTYFKKHPELSDHWYFQKFVTEAIYVSREGIFSHGYPATLAEEPLSVKDPFSLKSLSDCFSKYGYGFCAIDGKLFYRMDYYATRFKDFPEGHVATFKQISDSEYEDESHVYIVNGRDIRVKRKKKHQK